MNPEQNNQDNQLNLTPVVEKQTPSHVISNQTYVIIGSLIVVSLIVYFGFTIFNGSSVINSTFVSNNVSSGTSTHVIYEEALAKVPFVRQDIKIDSRLSQKFSISEIKNIPEMEKAYGFKFTQKELTDLEKNKFVVKSLSDTNIANELSVYENMREFPALYRNISGSYDYKTRTQANSVFISSDIMMHLFSVLSVELLKETENKYLYSDTLAMTKSLYDQSSGRLASSSSEEEKNKWMKIRDYFAIPYAILSTSIKPITAEDFYASDYYNSGKTLEQVQADFDKTDKDADNIKNVKAFVASLKLTANEEKAVFADLDEIYKASSNRGKPAIFKNEYATLPGKIEVDIPFTMFKPRGTYTSTSLRRQYFRAVQWYQQIPFLLVSKDLTNYAVGIGDLIGNDKDTTTRYKSLSSFVAFVVGESDDLDVGDYAAAYGDLGDKKAYDHVVLKDYLDKRKPKSKIKSMPVSFGDGSNITKEDEMNALAGMRFMSQKFIPDSYWTGLLTQGDEKAGPEGQLPGQASVLEVMSILGSDFANNHLVDLPFYADSKKAVDSKILTLKAESKSWSEDYWKSNLYTSSMWTISGMFDWQKENRSKLPEFMQTTAWDAKNLLTASGFWTELRHTSLLYAKQSFAEKGGGGGDGCDLRKVPEPAKGYIEPQAEAYDRLYYAAKRLSGEYKARNYKLSNEEYLERYITALESIREYTKLELENNYFNEKVVVVTRKSYDDNKDCNEYAISSDSEVKHFNDSRLASPSRWEDIRVFIVNSLISSQPRPVEGPILKIKEKRSAVVADIHTDKEGVILEEGTGIPRVIFVAVKDANGPRLTIGFTYSQYETYSGERLTDEQWQDKFYVDAGSDDVIKYKSKDALPNTNLWFQDLLGNK